jgi:hypothetical protein
VSLYCHLIVLELRPSLPQPNYVLENTTIGEKKPFQSQITFLKTPQ